MSLSPFQYVESPSVVTVLCSDTLCHLPPKWGIFPCCFINSLMAAINQSPLSTSQKPPQYLGTGGLRARWTERSAHKRRLTDLHDLQSKIKYANFAFLSMSACSLYLRECISFGISTFSSCTLETTSLSLK